MKIITKKKADEILKRIIANEIIGIEYIEDIEAHTKFSENNADITFEIGGIEGMKKVLTYRKGGEKEKIMDIYNGIDPETGKRFEDLTDDEFIECFGTVNCRDCKKRIDGTCERLKKIELARPWFTCQESAGGYPCKDYEPSEWQVLLKKYWRGTDIYVRYYSKTLYIPVCEIGNQSVRYFINFWDFYNDTMFCENELKWIYKKYYRRSMKSPTGYKLITKYRDDM